MFLHPGHGLGHLAVTLPWACRLKVTISGQTLPVLPAFNTIISLWLFVEILVICLTKGQDASDG